jgi:hypothetical protein
MPHSHQEGIFTHQQIYVNQLRSLKNRTLSEETGEAKLDRPTKSKKMMIMILSFIFSMNKKFIVYLIKNVKQDL